MSRGKYRDKGLDVLKAVVPELVVSHGVSVSGFKSVEESRSVCNMVSYRMRQLGFKPIARCSATRFVIKVERDFRYDGEYSFSMLTESDRKILERQGESFVSGREAMDLELIKSVAEARKDGIATVFIPEGRKACGYKVSIEAALKRLGYDDIMVLSGKDRLCLITVETEK
jgi:hypothetical protein